MILLFCQKKKYQNPLSVTLNDYRYESYDVLVPEEKQAVNSEYTVCLSFCGYIQIISLCKPLGMKFSLTPSRHKDALTSSV